MKRTFAILLAFLLCASGRAFAIGGGSNTASSGGGGGPSVACPDPALLPGEIYISGVLGYPGSTVTGCPYASAQFTLDGQVGVWSQDALTFVPTIPTCSLISDAAPSCNIDATNASNILSGTLAGAQLPFPNAVTLGGVESSAATSHFYLTGISTAGVPTKARPVCADLSDSQPSCSTDTTNASNIASGTLGAARLPSPTATTLGGVESLATASHFYLTGISTGGVPSAARPVCGDLSDAAPSCNTDTTNASNIASGTLAAARLPSLATLGAAASGANADITSMSALASLSHSLALTGASNTVFNTLGTTDASTAIANDAWVQNLVSYAQATVPLTIAGGAYSFASLGSGATVTFTGASGAVTSPTIAAGGTGYKVGDLFSLATGNGDAVLRVATVSSGVAATATVLWGGTGYTNGTNTGIATMVSRPVRFTYTLTGALTGPVTFIMPNSTYQMGSNQWIINNNTTGAHIVSFFLSNGSDAATGTGTVIPQGTNNNTSEIIATDGVTDIWPAVTFAGIPGTLANSQLPTITSANTDTSLAAQLQSNTAATNYGTAIAGPVTLMASTPYTGELNVIAVNEQALTGIGCTGNSTSTVTIAYDSPGSFARTAVQGVTTITTNGGAGGIAAQNSLLAVQAGTAITYSVASVEGSGCTTPPQYQIYFKVLY